MQAATVFNIQKFSLDDGPGIRTVVFLKGCPLRCRWCANPESQDRLPQLEWKASACVGCGTCLTVTTGGVAAGGATPGGAAGAATASTTASAGAAATHVVTAVEREGKRHVDVRQLRGDAELIDALVAACSARALTRVDTTRSVDEVLETCLQDKPFYDESGGGVTLSGGEALTWPDFCAELLERLRAEGVDTCIETEAHVPERVFRRIAPLADHLLVDLKHVDPARLEEQTGVDGRLMYNNLRWALANHLDVLPRTPVIPGFNDGPDDARTMARWLREAGATRVQLLPFHNFGQNKYELLDMPYALRDAANLHPEDLEEYRHIYLREGIEAFV